MTDDDRRLTERLRRYEASVPEEQLPTTLSFNRRPPWMAIAAVGAAAVLAGAFIAGSVLDNQNIGEVDPTVTPTFSPSAIVEPTESGIPSPTASPDAAGTASPTAQPVAPTPTPAPRALSGLAWAAGAVSTSEGSVSRITAEGGRFYALGSVPGTAVVWSSSDGVSWERADLPFPSGWSREVGFLSTHELASIGNRLVVIGMVGINDYAEVIVWESTDGRTWRELDTGSFREDAYWVTDISNGPGGLVVLSEEYVPGNSSTWRSTDGGHTWTDHRPPGEGVSLNAVVGTANGYLAVGGVGDPATNAQPSSPRIWHSPDGTNWTVVSVDGSGGLGQVDQITVDGSGRWVAVGALNGRKVAWRSSDGQSWLMTADFGPLGNSPRSEFWLAGVPDGFIAFDATTGQALTWASADGISWTQSTAANPSLGDTGFGWARGIGRIGDTVVVAGDGSAPGDSAARWQAWKGTIER